MRRMMTAVRNYNSRVDHIARETSWETQCGRSYRIVTGRPIRKKRCKACVRRFRRLA